MKTRIFLTTVLIILTTSLIAGATNTKLTDTLFASYLKNATKNGLTIKTRIAIDFNSASLENTRLILGSDNSFTLESRVADKSGQTGNELTGAGSTEKESMLENWVTGRENWEQTGNEMTSVNALNGEAILEQWVTGRENWEQTGNGITSVNALNGEAILEQWVTGRENWEQTGNEFVCVNAKNGSSILEQWISNRNCWEQK